jgi:hypothetical protein
MNTKERKVIEEKVVNAQRAYRVERKIHGVDEITMNLAHASNALSSLYKDLFGIEEFEKLMKKHFPVSD